MEPFPNLSRSSIACVRLFPCVSPQVCCVSWHRNGHCRSLMVLWIIFFWMVQPWHSHSLLTEDSIFFFFQIKPCYVTKMPCIQRPLEEKHPHNISHPPSYFTGSVCPCLFLMHPPLVPEAQYCILSDGLQPSDGDSQTSTCILTVSLVIKIITC